MMTLLVREYRADDEIIFTHAPDEPGAYDGHHAPVEVECRQGLVIRYSRLVREYEWPWAPPRAGMTDLSPKSATFAPGGIATLTAPPTSGIFPHVHLDDRVGDPPAV
jgi:hypothetical protein